MGTASKSENNPICTMDISITIAGLELIDMRIVSRLDYPLC
jgi:hypothetical protein